MNDYRSKNYCLICVSLRLIRLNSIICTVKEPWNYPLITFQLAATVLQGQVRGAFLRRRKPYERTSCYRKKWNNGCEIESVIKHIAAIEIQAQWKVWKSKMRVNLEQLASASIQGTWRRKSFRKIYSFYKKLIQQTEAANPRQVLRAIIPNEVGLFDSSNKIHVRFRLGGPCYPPILLYKIYTSRAVCDIGAFAPRVYADNQSTNSKKGHQAQYSALIRVGKKYFKGNIRTESPANEMTSGWYCREENNYYRPVASKARNDLCRHLYGNSFKENLFVYANKPRSASHERSTPRWQSKINRKARIKRKRLKWTDHACASNTNFSSQSNSSFARIIEDKDSVDEMLEWSHELDFDDYLR